MRTTSVKRVVLSSSCAAIAGDNADLDSTPGRIFTEDIWNTSSSVAHQPYSYSKTLAEREAWKIAGLQNRWSLVTINPSLVIGPGINPNGTSESFSIVRQLGDGTMKIGMGVVDVRAAFTPEASGRYITSGHNTSLPELAAALLERYGDRYPIARRTLPKWLVWLVGPIVNRSLTRKMISLNVDRPWLADNSRSPERTGDPLSAARRIHVRHRALRRILEL